MSILRSLVTDTYLFLLTTLVCTCISMSLHNIRNSILHIRYLSSIIRYSSTGKEVSITLKLESHHLQLKNKEGNNPTNLAQCVCNVQLPSLIQFEIQIFRYCYTVLKHFIGNQTRIRAWTERYQADGT